MADTQSARTIAYSHAPFSTWLGIVFLFVLFGLIVLAVIGPSPRTSDYEESRAKKRMENLKKLREETQKDLTTYAWVDKNKGVARIPIERAMELTVADLAQKKPAPAGRIAAPAAPAAAPPTGGSPPRAAHQQPDTVKPARPGAPAGSPATQGAASPPPAAQQSTPATASPAPATTP